jgi:hypothetical protein
MGILVQLLGGVIGAFIVLLLGWWYQRRRDRRDYLASIRLLRDELRHNIGVCHSLGPLGLEPVLVEPHREDVYVTVRLTLAKHLPPRVRLEVARAYAQLEHLPRMRTMLTHVRAAGRADFAGIERFSFGQLRDHLADVDHLLRGHLRSLHFHHELEVGPTELGGWQVRNPKTGLTPFDEVGKEVERMTIDALPALQEAERQRMNAGVSPSGTTGD